jgi:hypothetical protein
MKTVGSCYSVRDDSSSGPCAGASPDTGLFNTLGDHILYMAPLSRNQGSSLPKLQGIAWLGNARGTHERVKDTSNYGAASLHRYEAAYPHLKPDMDTSIPRPCLKMSGGRRCVHVIYPDDLLQADTVCAGRLSVSRETMVLELSSSQSPPKSTAIKEQLQRVQSSPASNHSIISDNDATTTS